MAEWRVKYDGTCVRCGIALVRGTPAVWDRATKTIHCIDCSGSPSVEPMPSPAAVLPAVDPGVAGRSARTEHDRRAAKRNARIIERWGTGFAAKVVRAVSSEPRSTRAWAIGAAGEEKLAAELAKVPELRILNDRRVPGTRGNIDHMVIAPAGVFVVDAKAHKGRIEIRDRGGFFRTDYRLTVGGRDCSSLADGMSWQVEAVVTVLRNCGADPVPAVTPVLCFLEVEWPLFRAPDSFHNVRIESARSLARVLTSTSVLTVTQADELAAQLSESLPAK